MLAPPTAPAPARRAIEDAETRDEVVQCLLAPRNIMSLADRPWTKEWLEAAIDLCLSQPGPEPLTSLTSAFRPGSPAYERLLRHCARDDLVAKFRDLERLRRRSEVQFELLTGASRRLAEAVCASEVVRLRARPGPFDWLAALRERRLVAFDGGGLRSRDLKRTLFLLAGLRVIHAVRRHFAETRAPLKVALVLEEAGALGLVTPFVLGAMQELRKAGLAVHAITQSSLDLGDRALFEALLANAPVQAWYQCLSPADQELGARALANATFDPLAVHYTRTRSAAEGAEPVTTESHGEATDLRTGAGWQDHRTGLAYRTRYGRLTEVHYKTPQLHAQEYRTALATLRVGERLVRDRDSVRRERITPLGDPRPDWEARAREAIERVRRRPIYLPPDELAPRPVRPSAAAVLRDRQQAAGAA
jgi:hypothetical protein